MRAVRVTRLDGPDALEVLGGRQSRTRAMGVPRRRACRRVAFPDVLLSRGLWYRPEPPFTRRAEVAGVVRAAP